MRLIDADELKKDLDTMKSLTIIMVGDIKEADMISRIMNRIFTSVDAVIDSANEYKDGR